MSALPAGPMSESVILRQLGSDFDHVFFVLERLPAPRISFLSPAAEKVFGHTVQALIADTQLWVDCIVAEDRERVLRAVNRWVQALPHDQLNAIGYRISRPDGQVRHLEATGKPCFDDNGQFAHVAGVVVDVTARRLAEYASANSVRRLQETAASLTAERDRLAQLAQAVPGAIYTMHIFPDHTRRFTFGVPRVADLFGVDPEALAADANILRTVIHPDDLEPVRLALQETLASQQPRQREYRINHRTRGLRWLEGHAQMVPADDGGFLWHGAVQDITERRAQQAEIQRLNAELEGRVVRRTAALQEAVKELEAFTYSVSHDLRAPLRAIDGFSQAVQDDYSGLLPDEGRRYLRIIRDSTKKMAQLIDDLLAFSRVGRAPLNRYAVDMDALVQQCLQLLAPQTAGRAIEWRIAALPPAQGDHALLRQVWVNLLSNAVKYSRDRAPAVITVDSQPRGDGGVDYRVQDNGAGFSMQYAHKLFGVFERLHRADEFEGTGVGLAIVQRIIKRHGGAISADSQPGRGATFTFHLGQASAAEATD